MKDKAKSRRAAHASAKPSRSGHPIRSWRERQAASETKGPEPAALAQRSMAKLWQPVDVASLAFFRMAFGGIMVWEVYRYFVQDRIRRYYIEPQFFFSYFGFDWVQPWTGNGMYYHFAALGVLGSFIALGLFYRVSAALFFVGFTYVFLLDQSLYLNHFYLICLISFLMIFIPAHRSFSLDARWGITRQWEAVPTWTLWLLRGQVGLVYFFGGIAKLNGDWLRGEPLRDWLARRSHFPVLGPMLQQEWMAWFFAYGGLLFDLLITPALLWRRTRAWAFALAVLFHLINSAVFQIGIFPWFMIAATTLFFAPDWPRRWLGRRKQAGARTEPARWPSLRVQHVAAALLGVYLAFQVLVPLRHWLYPGNVNWTEEGHRFSWRMKLRDKSAEAQFYVTDTATGQTQLANIGQHLNINQRAEMVTRPDMILQFAQHLASEARGNGASQVEVRAFVRASLNGRAWQMLIDPSVNLAAEPRTLAAARWIMPLAEPLRRQQPTSVSGTETNSLPR